MEETQQVTELSKQISKMQEQIEETRISRDRTLGRIGNIISDSTPIAKDEVLVDRVSLIYRQKM